MRNSSIASFTDLEGKTGRRTVRGVRALLVALLVPLAIAIASGTGTTDAQAPDPATQGEWSAPFETPVAGIHAAVLPTGKVLQYSYPISPGGSEAWTWDPDTSAFTEVPIDKNIFCGGHASLPDGTLLTVGGEAPSSPDDGPFGLTDLYNFDPFSETWSDPGDTQIGRWYPTTTTLPDGRVLILSGLDADGNLTPVLEVYDPVSGSQVLAGAEKFMSLYPWTHVLPDGTVLHTGPESTTSVLDTSTASWSTVATNEYGNRRDGTSVLLPLRPPDYRPQVMVMGGDDPATNTAEVIDLGAASPDWSYTGSMTHARHHANSVVLPNGEVLVVGGTAVANEWEHAVLPAEIYDPSTGSWTEMASLQERRIYHSTAMLLPDGRVLAAGTDGEFTAEIYSPPYLFQGPRPAIDAAPSEVDYGASFLVSTLDQDVTTVVLAKTSAVTHSFNMEQRVVELTFQQGIDTLNVQAPPNANLAPPGFYMLFLLNSLGVPSESTFVRLGETTDDDGDGLPNDDETLVHSTDPLNADSDGDSLGDGQEVSIGTDPNNPDTDGDGLGDFQEVSIGTDPNNPDTDGDTFDDGLEVFMGTDPFDACADTETLYDERGPAFGEPLSPWPPDINDDGKATLTDVLSFSPSFNKISPDPAYNPRFDLNGDGRVTLADVLSYSPYFNLDCEDYLSSLP